MILKFTVNIVCADGLAFLLVNYKFLISTEIQVLLFCVLVMPWGAFGKKWVGGGVRWGRGQKNLNFGRGYTKKKVGKKWGGGREEKNGRG